MCSQPPPPRARGLLDVLCGQLTVAAVIVHTTAPSLILTCASSCVLQMPLLVLEDIARRRLRKSGVRLARPLLIGWTTVVLMFTAYYFWYPPVEHYTDVAVRVTDSVNASAATAVQSVHKLLQSLGLQQAAVGGAAFVGSVSQAAL